ncbi:hypothetical protein COJ17_17635 [Bacillus thuringiensis]|uniref:hypothetical protein n=1 Tax=Bacillus thuringiensis TaxID=1428 RepID=UPI000BF5EE37|nr:hypothetical protein [Bacillus thuringiensis]PEW37846.1 hypothetical protein CN444_28365 [Bacillus thuringiensis]PFK10541.1 hypothetical protein COJ17_17635 [Bacillus thuringiensis]
MGRGKADFTDTTKRILAKRVGERCSNPSCRKLTSRPHPLNEADFINVGEAAHIKSAAKNGPRHDANMTDAEKKDIKNGIWLCQQCHKFVDNKDLSAKKGITVETLLYWKKKAEINAAQEAAYLSKNAKKYDWVITTFNETKDALNEFMKKWSKVKKPEFDSHNGSQTDAHRYLSISVRQNREKKDDFNANILNKINLIIDLSRIILEEGHPLLSELKVAINEVNETEEKTIENLVKKLADLVDFIVTQ